MSIWLKIDQNHASGANTFYYNSDKMESFYPDLDYSLRGKYERAAQVDQGLRQITDQMMRDAPDKFFDDKMPGWEPLDQEARVKTSSGSWLETGHVTGWTVAHYENGPTRLAYRTDAGAVVIPDRQVVFDAYYTSVQLRQPSRMTPDEDIQTAIERARFIEAAADLIDDNLVPDTPPVFNGDLGKCLNREVTWCEATTGRPVNLVAGIPVLPDGFTPEPPLVDEDEFTVLMSHVWDTPEKKVSVLVCQDVEDPHIYSDMNEVVDALRSMATSDFVEDYDWDAVAEQLGKAGAVVDTTNSHGCYLAEELWGENKLRDGKLVPTINEIVQAHDLSQSWQAIRCETSDGTEFWAALPKDAPEPCSTKETVCRAAGLGDTKNAALVAAEHKGEDHYADQDQAAMRHDLLKAVPLASPGVSPGEAVRAAMADIHPVAPYILAHMEIPI